MRSYGPMDGWMVSNTKSRTGEAKNRSPSLLPHLRPFFSITLGQRRKEVASPLLLFRRNRLNFYREASYENFSYLHIRGIRALFFSYLNLALRF